MGWFPPRALDHREGALRAALRDRQPPGRDRHCPPRPPGAHKRMNKPESPPFVEDLWNGSPHPLGATFDGQGINFAIFSRYAEKVELCLFDEQGKRELQRVALRERTDFVWHGYLPRLKAG